MSDYPLMGAGLHQRALEILGRDEYTAEQYLLAFGAAEREAGGEAAAADSPSPVDLSSALAADQVARGNSLAGVAAGVLAKAGKSFRTCTRDEYLEAMAEAERVSGVSYGREVTS